LRDIRNITTEPSDIRSVQITNGIAVSAIRATTIKPTAAEKLICKKPASDVAAPARSGKGESRPATQFGRTKPTPLKNTNSGMYRASNSSGNSNRPSHCVTPAIANRTTPTPIAKSRPMRATVRDDAHAPPTKATEQMEKATPNSIAVIP